MVWQQIDEGTVVDSHLSPRNLTDLLKGSKQAFVRFQLRQDAGAQNSAQVLRTSPAKHLQFPFVYQFLADLTPSMASTSARMLAPANLQHHRIGLRVVCELD